MSTENNLETDQDFFDWWETLPEDKLELIDGKLVIGTLAGSQHILSQLLQDYGADFVLPMAPAAGWWAALQQVYQPEPRPQTPTAWHIWADNVDYQPYVAPTRPKRGRHHHCYQLLMWALFHMHSVGLGGQMGRDWVIRLGEDGLSPDLIFLDADRFDNLHDRYLVGPPAIAIEITQEDETEQDYDHKRDLYEQWRVPEYWLFEPDRLKVTFHTLQTNGHYAKRMFDHRDLGRILDDKTDIVYDSVAVPELSLSLLKLWGMKEHEYKTPWEPFRRVDYRSGPSLFQHKSARGIRWDDIPFAPRVALEPTPIQFAEFASWCPSAKFEYYGGGLKISSTEGSRRVAGMLLMTFGLVEVVKLLHPREWVSYLDRAAYLPRVEEESARFLQQATYRPTALRADGSAESYWGVIEQLPDVSGYGHSMEECQQDLIARVKAWVLLRLARREPLPAAGEIATSPAHFVKPDVAVVKK